MYRKHDLPPSSPIVHSPEVNPEHPWLGLLPYKEEHRDFFFGRDREVDDILGRIRNNSLTILYGQSGLGKSSLLAAGVVPRLREQGFEPRIIRLSFTDRATLREQMLAAMPSRSPFIRTASEPSWVPSQATLWELFHRKCSSRSEQPIPVLIFDQFEEMFTLGAHPKFEGQVTDWFEQMADLLQNRRPHHLAKRFAEDSELAGQYHPGDAPVRIVFILREDYLAHLERWKARLPLLMQNRMALTLLTGTQARQAVLGPAKLGNHSLVSREVAERIVRTVARVSDDTPLDEIKAVPPLISLLCEQLNAARLSAKVPQITAESVRDQADDILQRFYVESFDAFPPQHRSLIRALIEDPPMITEGGFRNFLVRDDAEAQLTRAGVPDAKAVFDTLIQRRLITAEERDRVQRLEVTHDVLVPMLLRSRKDRQEREAKEQAERRLAEEAAKSRKRQLIIGSMALLSLIATFGAIFGWVKKLEAEASLQDVLESRAQVLYQAKRAHESEQRALAQANIARNLEARALAEAKRAADAEKTAKEAADDANTSAGKAKANLELAMAETRKAQELQEGLEQMLLELIPYRFAAALSDNNLERQSEIWADKVDYLNYGINTKKQVMAALARDIKSWPNRQFLILTKPVIKRDGDGWVVSFAYSYTHLDSARKPYTGELIITLKLNSEKKVASYKAEVLRAKKGY